MEGWLERYARTSFQRGADTNHDLKTPLNIAVLNLELMRMRARAVNGDDEKLLQYAAAVEFELHRMARIFDAYFVYCMPPKDFPSPESIDVNARCREAARAYDVSLDGGEGEARVTAHASRITELFRFVFEGTTRLAATVEARVATGPGAWRLALRGKPAHPGVELEKLFKFYYTDASGNPELSLATARLIAETYGGEVTATATESSLSIDVALPLGDS